MTDDADTDATYERLVADLPDGVLVLADGPGPARIRWANTAAAELTGIPLGQIEGLDLLELVHPDERAEVTAARRRRRGRWRATRRIAQPDGSWLSVDCGIAVLADGHPLGAGHVVTFRPAGTTMDRWTSDLRLDALLSHTDEAVLVYRPDGGLLYANTAGRGLLARSSATHDDQLGRPQAPPAGHPDLIDGLVGPPGSTVTARVAIPDPTGEPSWVQLRITNLLEDPAVAAVVVNATDVTTIVELEAQLSDAAARDPLTGLANRHTVAAALDALLARDTLVTVAFVDIDRFKGVNASFGHGAGDALLAETAQRLTAASGPGTTVGRFGGDEFVLVGVDGDAPLADAVAATFAAPFALHPTVHTELETVTLTATVGITTAAPGASAARLFHEADLAVGDAKAAGQRVGHYHEAQRAGAVERLTLEQSMTRALDDRGFELHYQPIVTLATGVTRGFEALCRWRLPDRGYVPPGVFIPLAEATGAVHRLGAWATRVCFDQVAAWADSTVSVALNLSPLQLVRPGLVEDVAALIAATGVDPRRLCFEITEAVLVDDLPTAVGTLAGLRDLGVRTALDDFGTGWSSLTYLRVVPVDTVKIDKSFIDDVADNVDDRAIVGAVIDLCHTLGKRVVAEGVETAAQAEALRELGCDDGQGWLYAMALPPADATAWLEDA